MKKILLLLFIFGCVVTKAQVPGYGGTSGGYLFRDRVAINGTLTVPAGGTPAFSTSAWIRAGALYYDSTGGNRGFYYWDGAAWQKLVDTAHAFSGFTLAAIGSSSNANGMSFSAGVLNLQPANASFGGVVTTTTQTFAGAKTFSSDITVNSRTIGKGGGNITTNFAAGAQALLQNTTGGTNTAIGNTTLFSNTTGSFNVAVGSSALNQNKIGTNNVAVGYSALANSDSSLNTAVGYQSMTTNTKGYQNAAFGATSLLHNTLGWKNAAFGPGSAEGNTTGSENTALGHDALLNNTTGSENIGVGRLSNSQNITGNGNTTIGNNAFRNTTNINYSISVGHNGGYQNYSGVNLQKDSVSYVYLFGNSNWAPASYYMVLGDDSIAHVKMYGIPRETDSTGMDILIFKRSDSTLHRIPSNLVGGGGGTVFSVATGLGLSGGTITTSGTIIADTSYLVNKSTAQVISGAKTFTSQLNLGGVTSSFPSIVQNGGGISFLLADGSAYTTIAASSLLSGSTTFNLVNTNASTINFAGASGNVTNFGGGATRAQFRFFENSGNGSNYIGFEAPSSIASNMTYDWPNAYPASNGYLLSSTTGGALSWVSGSSYSLFPVTGTGTATGAVTGELAGNKFQIQTSSSTLFNANGAGDQTLIRSFSGTNASYVQVDNQTDSSNVYTISGFNNNAKRAIIQSHAETGGSYVKFVADSVKAVYSGTTASLTGYNLVVRNSVSGAFVDYTGSVGGSLTVGTTTIASGTNTRVLYDNSGVLGEYSIGSGITTWWATPSSANLASALTDETGSGVTVFGTTPTFTNYIIDTMVVGSTSANGRLVLTGNNASSSNTGTLVNTTIATGNSAGTVALRAYNSGIITMFGATYDANHSLIIKGQDNSTNHGIKVLSNNESASATMAWNGFSASGDNTITSSTGNVLIATLGTKGLGVNVTPTSNLHTTAFATAYAAKTGTYSIAASDFTIDATSGTFTATLPTAVGITGRIYFATNTGSGVLTLGTTSSQTFVNQSGTPTTITINQFGGAMVQSNGANWIVLSKF